VRTQRISIRQAVPGMISADDVYSFNNQLIIAKGTQLNDKIITRLKFYQINELYITLEENKQATQPTKPTVKKEVSASQKIKQSTEFKQFNQTFDKSIVEFKSSLSAVINESTPIDITNLLQNTKEILSKSRNGIHVFDMLHCMREYDDLTFAHSLNVSLICNVFGHWLKLSEKDIEVLTLCGLLHDVGKLMLPPDLINKKEPLTDAEFATIKTHTVQGYQALKDQDVDIRVKYVALMHHERCDGSGYPNGFKGSQIDSFAKIVAIADVYDAMTSARVYRPALSPFEAISVFESEGLQKYDPHYIMTFLEEIVQSYVGNRVKLSNKQEGEIRMINRHALSKPIVQVGKEFIDLSKENGLSIISIM
jgi:putative nucleotidyltransferase with HDIG domain